MAAFAQFGSDLDKATQDKLAQGERLMEVLKQPQFSPFALEEQVAVLYISVNGFLMDIETRKIPQFVKGFLEHLKTHHSGILRTIAETGDSMAEIDQELAAAVENYKQLSPQGA
jgi:F-type H+-transporting ATPase subunit alpha